MEQNIEKLEIIPFCTSTFPREEKCVVCKRNLVEEISSEIISYTQYNTRDKCPDGSDIYCPSCKIIYKYSHTFGSILKEYYDEMKVTHYISVLRLKEDFLNAQFDTLINQGDIPKGTILYLPLSPDASRKKFNECITTIRKLKSGLEKEFDGYLVNSQSHPKIYNEESWEKIPALRLWVNKEDVFEDWKVNDLLGNLIIIPISMLDFPDEFYPDFPEGNLIPELDIE